MKIHNSKPICVLTPIFHGLIAFLGIVLLNFHSHIIDIIYNRILILTPTSHLVEEWQNPTVPVTIDLYFFNWTNPEQFKNTSVKLKFKEMGPYILNQEYKKVNVTFNENNTVTHRNEKFFYFNEKLSSGSLEDNVTTINVISVVASDKARDWNFFYRKGLSVALNSVPYDITKDVKGFLFEGYEDSLLASAKFLPFLEDLPKIDKFAWFYQRNGSAEYEGVYNIGNGLGNTTLGTLYRWNYKDVGPYPANCSRIQASSGEIFGQRIGKGKLEFFFTDFCRKVILDYKETVIWDGIEAYKFILGVSFLDSGTYNPENTCLCSRKCRKFGVIDYASCKFGAPVYLSNPHFLMADPSFVNEIEGLEPDQKKHESFLIIHPRTGLVLQLSMGIQLNVLVQPNPGIRRFSDVPEVMIPAFWFSVKSQISGSLKVKIKILLWVPAILKGVSILIVLLGSVLFLLSIHQHLKASQRKVMEDSYGLNEQLQPLKT